MIELKRAIAISSEEKKKMPINQHRPNSIISLPKKVIWARSGEERKGKRESCWGGGKHSLSKESRGTEGRFVGKKC